MADGILFIAEKFPSAAKYFESAFAYRRFVESYNVTWQYCSRRQQFADCGNTAFKMDQYIDDVTFKYCFIRCAALIAFNIFIQIGYGYNLVLR
ncbi:MAG: hypothetical protein BWY95_00936 [Bacteroidetes bacterium ADurb.BinA104]|nr:MAG: hypothetical protein BWY95_00936 [Bacteroidetes bacterium ADurb.BinA104]